MKLQPYLFFSGKCDEALAFYEKALGARVNSLRRWKDNPDPSICTGENAERVMHADFTVGDTNVLASDGMESEPEFRGFALTLTARDEAEANRVFDALADGGEIQMPLGKTFFSSCFGMVSDRFGIQWMVIAG